MTRRPASRLSRPQSATRVFTVPALLAIAAVCGLVAGLAGEGAWDAAACLLLGLLPLSFAFSWSRRHR